MYVIEKSNFTTPSTITTTKQISVHFPSHGLDLASFRSVITRLPPRPSLMHDESAY